MGCRRPTAPSAPALRNDGGKAQLVGEEIATPSGRGWGRDGIADRRTIRGWDQRRRDPVWGIGEAAIGRTYERVYPFGFERTKLGGHHPTRSARALADGHVVVSSGPMTSCGWV
jgi:hypothetical protein